MGTRRDTPSCNNKWVPSDHLANHTIHGPFQILLELCIIYVIISLRLVCAGHHNNNNSKRKERKWRFYLNSILPSTSRLSSSEGLLFSLLWRFDSTEDWNRLWPLLKLNLKETSSFLHITISYTIQYNISDAYRSYRQREKEKE